MLLRIGHIRYANCTPIFNALVEMFPEYGPCLVDGVPAELNRMLLGGAVDLCPSSSICYAQSPDKLIILPELSISSIGAVQSVLLFSRKRIEDLGGNEVLLSAESATSVNLLKILLKQKYQCECSYRVTVSGASALTDGTQALLLIGDAALRASFAPGEFNVYDLGELWFNWTGLPFVFALWLADRQICVREQRTMRLLAERFVMAKECALASLEQIAELANETSWMGRERLLSYWKVLSYDLTESHMEGLRLFYRCAAEQGLIEKEPTLELLV